MGCGRSDPPCTEAASGLWPGAFREREVPTPLGIDFTVGLPEKEAGRAAELVHPPAASSSEQAAIFSQLAPAALALAWGRDAAVLIAGSYLGALYSPLIISAAIGSVVEYLIALVVFVITGLRGAPPRPGPTLRKE